MKHKLTIALGIAAVLAVKTAQAIPDTLASGNVENGTSKLVSTSTAGSDIYVNWAVNLVAGVYTYNYQIFDASSDIVDSLDVAFSTLGLGALTGGNYTTSDPNSVTWSLGGSYVKSGGISGDLYFTSDLPPVWGNANGADANPPSPWASVPGGQKVPVPAVPDGGATVMLLGAALSVIGLLRKKLIA